MNALKFFNKISSAIAISILFFQTAYANDNNVIINWNPEIPASAAELFEELQNQAGQYTYDSDDGSCGGVIQMASLHEHRRIFDANETPVHIIKVRFEVTMPVNYCQSEKVIRCEIKYNILNPAEITYSNWQCDE